MRKQATNRSVRGFTLVETLVVVAVVALLMALLLPALASARKSGRSAVCLSNLRQAFALCRTYADEYAGVGPAIGQPYGALPNWALVVQERSGRYGADAGLYAEASVLVCPETVAVLGRALTRTYAMNATGHAGAAGDPDNYDALPAPGSASAAIRFDRVAQPGLVAILVDSSAPATGPGQPPATRTSSVIDFRNAAHVPARLGLVHAGSSFNAARFDGSAGAYREVPAGWARPLP